MYDRKIALTNNVTPLLSVVVGLLLVFRNGSAYTRWDDGRKQWAKMVGRPEILLGQLINRTRTFLFRGPDLVHFAQMSISRSLVRTIWVNVGAASPVRGAGGSLSFPSGTPPAPSVKAQSDKVSAARLVVAFLVATKHHIRCEYGVKWPGESGGPFRW